MTGKASLHARRGRSPTGHPGSYAPHGARQAPTEGRIRAGPSVAAGRPNGSATPKHQPQPKDPTITTTVPLAPADRAAVVTEVVAGYEALMQRLADSHAPDFLEIDITMPQAKILYLLGAAGDLHMSSIVATLGVSLSTVSGLVDRLVDHGLAARREDPADRRQVVVGLTPAGADFVGRFRELNAREFRELLAVLDDADLATVRDAMAALARAATRLSPHAAHAAAAHPGAPSADPTASPAGAPGRSPADPGTPEPPAPSADRGRAARVVPTRKDPA